MTIRQTVDIDIREHSSQDADLCDNKASGLKKMLKWA